MAVRYTTETFIEKANKVHNNYYDYSLIEYTKSIDKVKIVCPKHGVFEQKAVEHTRGKGCNECGKFKKSYTTKQFIEKAKKVHDDKFDYSLVNYKGNKTKIKIICSEHGVFEQTAGLHLLYGCSQCAGVLHFTQENFLQRAKEKHGDKYDYSSVKYKNFRTKIKIICPIHGEFEQTPHSHLNGHHCRKCSMMNKDNGFGKSYFLKFCNKNNNGLGTFYILKCFNEDEEFYKIGITSRTVKKRYNAKMDLPYNYEIIQEITDIADNIWKLELFFKRYIKQQNIHYLPLTFFNGSLKECFII